jgi:hypothetical protein
MLLLCRAARVRFASAADAEVARKSLAVDDGRRDGEEPSLLVEGNELIM